MEIVARAQRQMEAGRRNWQWHGQGPGVLTRPGPSYAKIFERKWPKPHKARFSATNRHRAYAACARALMWRKWNPDRPGRMLCRHGHSALRAGLSVRKYPATSLIYASGMWHSLNSWLVAITLGGYSTATRRAGLAGKWFDPQKNG